MGSAMRVQDHYVQKNLKIQYTFRKKGIDDCRHKSSSQRKNNHRPKFLSSTSSIIFFKSCYHKAKYLSSPTKNSESYEV